MNLDANKEEEKFREWCKKENIEPESSSGISVWAGWIQGQLSFIEMVKPEFNRLKEIERRYRWVEEHLEDFDQLNIPEREK